MWEQSKVSAALRLGSTEDSSSVTPLDCIRMARDVGCVVWGGEERVRLLGRTGSDSGAGGSSQACIRVRTCDR